MSSKSFRNLFKQAIFVIHTLKAEEQMKYPLDDVVQKQCKPLICQTTEAECLQLIPNMTLF